MKVSPQCVPCLIRRAIFEAGLVHPDRVAPAIRAACSVFSRNYRPGRVSARLATEVHRAVYRAIGSRDPYREMKHQSNDEALRILPAARRLVERSDDRLGTAMLASIAGNIMDFGVQPDVNCPADLSRKFGAIMKEGLAVNDLPRLRPLLKKGTRALYFSDNCGEIVLDILVFRELSRIGVSVTLVVKKEPILTDATMEDVSELGLDDEVAGVLDSGAFAVGIDFDRTGPALRRALRECDVIISKGMANFESFSDTRWRPIAHLMRTKCAPVARATNCPENVSILKLWPGPHQSSGHTAAERIVL